MDLFSHAAREGRVHQPLAERMRPRTLEEYVGQRHLLGPGRILADLARRPTSLVLWGPPGTGKTTLAQLIGRAAGADWVAMSAVSSGVKEVRDAAAIATRARDEYGRRTVLFLDELHRFSKAQQDALLPHVESGTLTLIGATTENPSFGVVAALLSRCRVVRLEALDDADLKQLAERALSDQVRGLGGQHLAASPEVIDGLVALCHGDARQLYTILEVAAGLARAGRQAEELADITAAHLEEAAQTKTLLYDKVGDEHYGVVSAFIKSMRGSDPHAAVYWMTRMLEAGEEPRFVLRRMVIFASEDIGLADPQALSVAVAALHAHEMLGMPEAIFALTQTAVYLACAPKSNSALTAYAKARRLVLDRGALPVPKKLRNPVGGLGRAQGHGEGYRYPHEFDGGYVPEDYLPEPLVGEAVYQPTGRGFETELAARLAAWSEQKRSR